MSGEPYRRPGFSLSTQCLESLSSFSIVWYIFTYDQLAFDLINFAFDSFLFVGGRSDALSVSIQLVSFQIKFKNTIGLLGGAAGL